jgi:type I restriction enzyme, S subunit
MSEPWPFVPLEEAVGANGRVIGGPFGSDLTQDDYRDAGIPVIRVSNQNGALVDGEFVFVTEIKASQLAGNIAFPGDIVVVQRGSTYGKTSRIPRNSCYSKYIICQSQMAISVDRNQSDDAYIFQALRSSIFQRYMKRSVIQTGQPHINLDILRRARLPMPPLPAQRKIAEILRKWDEAIEKLEALRAAKREQFEALRACLISRADRLGRRTTFGEFLTESRVVGSDGANARKISVKLYGKGAVEKSDTRSGSVNTQYYVRKPGQLIYSKLDFLNGAFALVRDELAGFETTLDLPAFDCSADVNPRWLLAYLTRPSYYAKQLHLARGQRKARRVSPDDWLASPVRLPDREAQEKIVEILAEARADLDATERHLGLVDRQKRGLMQKLLTGEWRVTLEPAVA